MSSSTSTTTTTNGSSAASLGSSSSSLSPRPTTTSSGSGSGVGTGQACAACKYQRRKCTRECPLAPYFLADEPRRFLNAHRLFGVKNIQHTLRKIDPEHWPDAMRTLIYQADARAADPVGGCVSIIDKLQREMRRAELELAYVKQQIAIYQQVAAADPEAAAAGTSAAAAAVAAHDNAVSMDALYAAGQGGGEPVVPEGDGLVFHDQQGLGYHLVKAGDHPQPPPQQLQFYNYFGYDDGAAGNEATSSHEDDDATVREQYGFGGSTVALGDQLEQHCQIEAAPFVDAFNVKPQGMLAAAVEHHGVGHRQEKLKHGAERQMEEAATGGAAPCHLELGFSSF
ncbi:hypothetical protein HU200_065102 [Digitaria exilis]|uniref:LOB domain-containing protein n=1 Tax=Digitaria exilis TaxID=1010633 RepID=A0A835DXT0_9POAL|nr:hypothetical protein HU200_065102 [Digitaria exilis]